MIRIRSIVAACTLAFVAGCTSPGTSQKAAATQSDTASHAASPAQSLPQASQQPAIFKPIHRAAAASDSMAARAARMNAATDSIIH